MHTFLHGNNCQKRAESDGNDRSQPLTPTVKQALNLTFRHILDINGINGVDHPFAPRVVPPLGESGLNPAGGNTLILDKTVIFCSKLTELSTLTLTRPRVFQWDSPKDGASLCATFSHILNKEGRALCASSLGFLPKNGESGTPLCASFQPFNRESGTPPCASFPY